MHPASIFTPMKILPAIFFLITALPIHAELKFETPVIEADAALDATTLIREYKFTNIGTKAIKITQADAGCSCLGVEVAAGKFTYAPGESGTLRATFEIGNFQGTVEKPILIWLEGDREDSPSVQVTLRVHIPVIIAVEPKTLKWEQNGSTEMKSLDVRMDYPKPIKITSVTTSNENFSTKLVTIEEGKHYKVEVTPRSTASGGFTIVRIETDSDVEKQRIQQSFAVIAAPIKQQP
ncbi:MAG: hypothetical protein RLZZ505_2311 [Verrucomicrobiota bacterium]|jgi:hypothetical protein